MRTVLSLILSLCTVCLCFADAALDRMKPYLADRVIVGEPGSETAHQLSARESSAAPGRGKAAARSARRGGTFSYVLNVADSALPQSLHVRYSGDDRAPAGEKYLFEIQVDGKRIAVQGLDRNFPNTFLDEYYDLPAALLEGKKKVTVSFVPYDAKSSVGGVYAVSVLKEKRADEYARFDRLEHYRGLEAVHGFLPFGKRMYRLSVPGRISYTEPDGPRGWYHRGWLLYGDGVVDLTKYWGLELNLDVQVSGGVTLVFTAYMNTVPKEDRDTGDISRTVKMRLAKNGEQTVYLPFADFVNPAADVSNVVYRFKQLSIQAEGMKGEIIFDSIRVLGGYRFAVDVPRRSKPGKPDSTVVYDLNLTNTAKEKCAYDIRRIKRNWEAMDVVLEPEQLVLEPGKSGVVKVKVHVPAKIPAGGREYQKIRITPEGDPGAAKEIQLITFADIAHPYLIHDAVGWRKVREKVKKYDWAKKEFDRYVKSAESWKVPEVAVFRLSPDTRRPGLVANREEQRLMEAAIAYRLTGKKKYAEKAALFLRRIADPVNGFPKKRQAGFQSSVQEGHFFQHLAQAYDLIHDAGVLTPQDIGNIENTFRIYCDMIVRNDSNPAGANWALSEQTGALFCALALKDLERAEYFQFGPGMISDKLSSYTMSDGWWYECSISYNLWCAEEFTQGALAMERFGYSLLNRNYPVNFASAPDFPLDDKTELDQRRNVHYGHSFRIFGGIEHNTVTIKKMFDAMVPYIDYRGWIFGINDSYENNVGGGRFELAYYAFRDPFYASFIKRAPERNNLIYGVGELPENTPEIGKGSAYSDNVGLLMLRSTQKEARERIQAVLKYGTHGGYHGHYDRTGLLSMMRYGRSFFNPEMIWYSYQPFMYNFYVQSSVAKNMVTVDLKQQEVDDSRRLLFRTGGMLQAGAVETTASWSNPGYGGLRWGHIGFPTFSSKAIAEGRYVPVPNPEPRYGSMSGFTEPVLQRRLMGVTDDYILIADFDQGGNIHHFDQLFQIKGLLDITAPSLKKVKHTAQLDSDLLKSAQFITDCSWYDATGTLKMSFLTKFGPGADNRGTRINGEPGNLYINLYYAWPNGKRTAFTGLAPENHSVARKLAYAVKGDGKVLAQGGFGAWILGDGRIDVPLKGVKTLELSTAIEKRANINTLFWADAVIVTADGKTLRLTDLKPKMKNVLKSRYPAEKDYQGGKINIAGNDYRFGLPADPVQTGTHNPAVYTFDLSNLNAVRLKAVVGGDYPVGCEKERRMTVGVRATGIQANFITIMEPFEKTGVIASVEAQSANEVTVRLKDGRTHRFTIRNLDGDGSHISLEMKEFDAQGTLLRTEIAGE